ncbi:hypothetical protein OsI_38711 [Oryza sativa Indica Group]|uniref:Uncharacterized protein n=2 Tax=Oryza sativa TaxID=4530 RepID=B9GDR2_ORYSJ|nr:hypothetical protein OsI_38711 [Oryza sativa Indica Group]EEE53419.1 hypothetical protein OsJ_36494 [Oryza sativa Japonica Group]
MGRCWEAAGGDVKAAGMRKKKESPSKMPRPLISIMICLLSPPLIVAAADALIPTSCRLFVVSSNISLAFMSCLLFFYRQKDYFYCNQRKSLGKIMLVLLAIIIMLITAAFTIIIAVGMRPCAFTSGTPPQEAHAEFSSHQITTHRGRNLLQIPQAQHPSPPPHAICVERIHAVGSYTAVAEFPDGSGRLLLVSQDGKMIWLVTFFSGGGSAITTLFLDLSDMVVGHGADGVGIKGIAFDPDFINNGCYYVSLTCDSVSSSNCGAAAAAAGANGAQPQRYRYWLLVAMFSVKDSMVRNTPS